MSWIILYLQIAIIFGIEFYKNSDDKLGRKEDYLIFSAIGLAWPLPASLMILTYIKKRLL